MVVSPEFDAVIVEIVFREGTQTFGAARFNDFSLNAGPASFKLNTTSAHHLEGDTTMNCCHKLTGLLALGLFALMPAVVSAQEIKKADIDALRTDLALMREAHREQMKLLLDQLVEMRSRITALEQKADTLQKAQVRTSFAPPQTGTIRLENRLGMPAMILINDVPYRLQPFQTMSLPAQPVGTFNYEVLVDGFGSLQPRVSRTLLPNQVFTIFTFQQ
jgi:hypothetical protein